MERIASINALILIGAALVLAGILSSLLARRFGAPLLLVFLVIGMLAGEQGPGGIVFDNVPLAVLIGSLALAIILFDGGMRIKVQAFRVGLRPALLLATVGVVLTAAFTGVAAHFIFGLPPLEALLLGSVISSTDAAAVLFLMNASGLQLNERVRATLEIESATNDPVAVFLTIALVELLRNGGGLGAGDIAGLLATQAIVGAAIGVAGGLAVSALVNRLPLPPGLQPLLVASSAVFIFALASVGGGSGFLAVYLAGLVVGNRPLRAHANIADFHDAATWFCQIVMFLVLGLLVTPSQLLAFVAPALAVALALMLVARPLTVVLCLWPFRFAWRETGFIAWVGLRGAVGIFLASIPLLSGLPRAELYFNVGFVVVLASLLVQGWSVSPVARRLGVALPAPRHPVSRVELDLPGQLEYEMVGYRVPADSPVLHHVAPPPWARPMLVVRGERVLSPTEAGPLQPQDHAYFLAPPWRVHLLDRLFTPPGEMAATDGDFFGDFAFAGDVPLARLAELYGLPAPADRQDWTLGQYIAHGISEHPVVGDRLRLGASALIVREVEGDCVTKVGLQLEAPPAARRWLDRLRERLDRLRAAR